MCRLFGLSAGRANVRATFWLLEAPNSLAVQSRRNPDGYGVGTFDERAPPMLISDPRPPMKMNSSPWRRKGSSHPRSSRTFATRRRGKWRGKIPIPSNDVDACSRTTGSCGTYASSHDASAIPQPW